MMTGGWNRTLPTQSQGIFKFGTEEVPVLIAQVALRQEISGSRIGGREQMDRWLSYDQVTLIPRVVSSLEHRAEADTSVQFGPVKLSIPLIAAPMPDVSNGLMADKLMQLGSLGFIHRFQHPDEMQNELLKSAVPEKIGIALPVNDREAWLMVSRFYQFGTRIFCIDTANGANQMVEKTIKRLKDTYSEIFIVAGNVASAETYRQLEDWGADAIRVGIAGGSVCETRTETGVYSPMASVVQACANAATPPQDWGLLHPGESIPPYRVKKALLIADGGIRTPGDMCKALALGADLVMVGGVFGGTKESPGGVMKIDGKLVKILRGAASYSVQSGKSGYVEGRETTAPYQGSVEKVISRFGAGLRSSMSYSNARTLAEFRQNVQIVEIG